MDAKLCPIPVFVDDGWPYGQCLREKGHTGLCDVYDARPDPLPQPQSASTPTSKCECELRDRQWNGFGRCLRCGCQYVDGRTFPPPYCTEPQACLEYEGCDCKTKGHAPP